ncbi:MAG: hypothetical protein AAB263_04165 [Planctomycetota bacterium]
MLRPFLHVSSAIEPISIAPTSQQRRTTVGVSLQVFLGGLGKIQTWCVGGPGG